MKSTELFRKAGYRQRYKDSCCVIYDLKEREEFEILPQSIIIKKYTKDVQLFTTHAEDYIHSGIFTFGLNEELLQAITKKLEEFEE